MQKGNPHEGMREICHRKQVKSRDQFSGRWQWCLYIVVCPSVAVVSEEKNAVTGV